MNDSLLTKQEDEPVSLKPSGKSRKAIHRTQPLKELAIPQFISLYSQRNDSQSAGDCFLQFVSLSIGAQRSLVIQKTSTNNLKISSVFGFSKLTSKLLLDQSKIQLKQELAIWLNSIAQLVAGSDWQLVKETSLLMASEILPLEKWFGCQLGANHIAVFLNPELVTVESKPRIVHQLESLTSVVSQLLIEEKHHRNAYRSLSTLSECYSRKNEAVIYVSSRSYRIKHATATAYDILLRNEEMGNDTLEKSILSKKFYSFFQKDKSSLKSLLDQIVLQSDSPDSPENYPTDEEFGSWKLKNSDSEIHVQYLGCVVGRHNSKVVILLLRSLNEFEQKVCAAEKRDKSTTEFVAHLGHEIRTPLNCILSILPLLMGSALGEEQRRYTQIIQQSSIDMMMMVGDFLDIAKLEARKMSLFEVEINLQSVIEPVLNSSRLAADAKKLKLNIHIDPNFPEKIFTDPSRLRQILQNLINNAVKFTRKGSISLEIHSNDENPEFHRISISVKDTGIGIAPENHKLIFKSFRQVDESSTQETGGTGLGLAICKKLAKLMDHGSLVVDSELGVGSCFTLCFNSPILDNELLLKRYKSLLNGKRVLVVDDIANNRIAMFSLLESWYLQPTVSGSAKDVIKTKFTPNASEPYDLALLDLRMPEMDGVGLAKWIRRQGFNCPLILLSSSPEDSEGLSAEERAMFSFAFVRPLPPRRLLASIITALGSTDRALSLIANEAVSLPVQVGNRFSSGSRNSEAARRASRLPADVRSTQVLIAENNPTNQKVMESLMRRLGYQQLTFVENGQEVLERCENPSTHFDILLLDIRMPVLNGFETSKILTNTFSQRRLSRPKILAISSIGINSEELQNWCSKGYIDDCLAKPIDLGALKLKLDRLLHDSDQKRRLSTPL